MTAEPPVLRCFLKAAADSVPEVSEKSLIRLVLLTAAARQGVSSQAVTVYFCNDEVMRRLNRKYRDIDRSTDVLSFPTGNVQPTAADYLTGDLSLGDIIISLPRATEQARQYGHSRERELCFLALHGFLHLLGYDHESDGEREEMEAMAELILNEAGVTR